MKARFEIDPNHAFVVGQNDTPRIAPDSPMVDFSVRRTPPVPFALLNVQSGPVTYPPEPRSLSTSEEITKAVFYGPHECVHCGCLIVKQGNLPPGQNGAEYDYPEGPIYPNTTWVSHVHREPAASYYAEREVFGFSLKPSAARAVASMILSAATEAGR